MGDNPPNTRRDRTDQARRLGLRTRKSPEDDLRGKAVYDAEGQRIGSVGDLYIDPQEREVRFLDVGAGGFLGMGEKRFLVPVEAIVEIAEDRVTIEPGRTEKVEGPAPVETTLSSVRGDTASHRATVGGGGNHARSAVGVVLKWVGVALREPR